MLLLLCSVTITLSLTPLAALAARLIPHQGTVLHRGLLPARQHLAVRPLDLLVDLVNLIDALATPSALISCTTHRSSVFLCCARRRSLSASSAALATFFASAFLAFLRWILVSPSDVSALCL